MDFMICMDKFNCRGQERLLGSVTFLIITYLPYVIGKLHYGSEDTGFDEALKIIPMT